MKEAIHMAISLMAASARTAPKAGGKDFLEIVVITGEDDLGGIANAMREYAPKSTNEAFWLRDASNIENSEALLLTFRAFLARIEGFLNMGCGFQDFSAIELTSMRSSAVFTDTVLIN